MSEINPADLSVLTRDCPVKLLHGLSYVTFKEILAFTYKGGVTGHFEDKITRENLSPSDLDEAPFPFKMSGRANRLLDVLERTFANTPVEPRGAAGYIATSRVNPQRGMHLDLHPQPIRVNDLSEGLVYVSVTDASRSSELPMIGTANPSQGLFVAKEGVHLVNAGDMLHFMGACMIQAANVRPK